MTNSILENIHVFPFKGFAAVSLNAAMLRSGEGLPNDRRFAVTRGVSPTGKWMPARSFYINALVDGLQKIKVDMSSDGKITLTNPAGSKITIDPENGNGLKEANAQIPKFMEFAGVASDLPQPQIVERGALGQWDYPDTSISIINSATVRAIEEAFGKTLDPVRFRGNLIIDGIPAWEEFSFLGKRLRIGDAEFEVMRPIVRCPAPGVNPDGGERDIDFERMLPEHFGHAYCGMYAVVAKDGAISVSDTVEIAGDATMTLETAGREAEDYRLWPRLVEVSACEKTTDTTRMSLSAVGPWPLPEAKAGQRLRFLMGAGNWTSEYIAETTPDRYHIEINKSATDDPVTEHLRSAYGEGDRIAVCGPFGRV